LFLGLPEGNSLPNKEVAAAVAVQWTLARSLLFSQTRRLPEAASRAVPTPEARVSGAWAKEDWRMKKIAVLVLVAFFAVAGVAAATEMEGKVKSVDKEKKELVLEDGTKIVWTEGIFVVGELEQIKEGKQIKANYVEKDGQNVATSFEMSY
jgi:hypothetical protein